MSHPWLKFYPRDWRGDQALRAVSVAARGLWIEMLCIMHEASPYGHLILGGRAVSNDVLARVAGLGVEECGALLAELESAGVLSRTRKGVIYSRRMVKDHSRAEKGRKSVKRRWEQGAENKEKKSAPNRPPNKEPITQKPEARRTLSGSARARPKIPLPDDWEPQPFKTGKCKAIIAGWSTDRHDTEVAKFKATHRRNGSQWVSWQDAWETWVLNSPGFERQSAQATGPPGNEFWEHYQRQQQAKAAG